MVPDVDSRVTGIAEATDDGALVVLLTIGVTPSSIPKVRASELVGRGWLNTGGASVSLAELRGKVVVLDFWTL